MRPVVLAVWLFSVIIYSHRSIQGIYCMACAWCDVYMRIIYVTWSDLSLRNACRYVVQVGSGAEHMHDNGFCHGDIKPENILMFGGNDGSLVPKLADFGTTRGESLLLCIPNILRGNFTKSTLNRRALRCQSVATFAHKNTCLRRPLTRYSFWPRFYRTLSYRVHALGVKTSGLTPVLTCLPARDFP